MFEDELLEMLLFCVTPHNHVRLLTAQLLATFGDLNGVMAAPEARLLAVPCVDGWVIHQIRLAEAIAHRMARSKVMAREVISSWEALVGYCRTVMAHRETEAFRVLYLDRRNILVADEEQGRGTVDHVPVYPREVAKRALELNASAVILVHNHPSGDPTPSPQDVEMTRQVEAACQAIGVVVHDHLIVGKGAEVSMRSRGVLGSL